MIQFFKTAKIKSKPENTLSSNSTNITFLFFQQTIVKHLGQERLDEYVKLLKTVDKLKELPNGTLMRMADCFEPQKFHKGDYIIRQNENGDCFFVIREGKVKITKVRIKI